MTDQVTALDLPMVDPLPERTQKYFDVCQDKLGMVPNVLKAHAFDIAKLEAFTGLYNDLMLGESRLSKLEREMIAVVVSSINSCFYCQTAHGAAVREMGTPELGEMMVMNYRVADLEPRQRAMLDFAVKVSQSAYEVNDGDFQTLHEHGFTDEDAWDIAGIAAFFGLSNRMANVTSMRANPEFYSLGR